MKTTDLFKSNRSAKKINESIGKVFGKRLDLDSFDLPKLENARNKLRTQISQVRGQSGFNENLENEALTQAQWMLDAINSEIAEREEFIADPSVAEVAEGFGSLEEKVAELMKRFEQDAMEVGAYGDPDIEGIVSLIAQGDYEGAADEVYGSFTDKDGDEPRRLEPYVDDLQAEFEALGQDSDSDEGGETDDNYAMASAGFGSDEDYGDFPESIEDTNEAYINNAKDAIGILADIRKQSKMAELGQGDPVRPNQLVNDLWDVITWIESNMQHNKEKNETIQDESSDFVKGVKRFIKGKKSPDDVRDAHLAKATFGDQSKKDKEEKRYDKVQKLISKESTQGESMTTLREGEVQQASAIVTAKTMVDRVSRWIEELSGMENDTLLQLGDSIRDEMGSEQAKSFISAVAPAIQQALENLKTTRETLSTGVRQLTGEEQGAEMLGSEPEGEDMAAAPDEMNMPAEEPEAPTGDEFAAAEPAAGGLEDAGREQRESINRSNSLLRVLAG